MTSEIWERVVFVCLPTHADPVPAGLFTLDTMLGAGRFQYGRRYLARPDAIAIDPVNLPLSPVEYQTRKNRGIFGALGDMLPDSWGKYILAKKLGIPFGTLKDHELLDLASTSAVGALALGLTPDKPASPRNLPATLTEIDEIAWTFDQALAGSDIPPEVRHLLVQGTSLGGAQPKCPVIVDGVEWIAKFASTKTAVRYPPIEYATMTLAGRAGITIPEIRLLQVSGRSVFLIRRFDRAADRRRPFLSALAVSDLDIDELEKGSYLELASRMRRFIGDLPAGLRELFRRIAFNIHVRNEDDHLRNHGFFCSDGKWSLAPAYDIVPTPARKGSAGDLFHLSLMLGERGSEASTANLLSRCDRFGLDREEAMAIVTEVRTALVGWEAELSAAGVIPEDIEAIRWCFEGGPGR